jgi:hypothetical protein
VGLDAWGAGLVGRHSEAWRTQSSGFGNRRGCESRLQAGVAAGGTGGLALRQLAGMEAWGASGTRCGLGQAQEAADV